MAAVRVTFSAGPAEVAVGVRIGRPAANAQAFIYGPSPVTFTIDAAGRHASEVIGSGATTTYEYLGTSDVISSETTSGVTTYSGIDAIGDRLSQGSGASVAGWLIADLHGNIVAAASSGSSPAYLDAYRYDPYGETCGSWAASSGSLTVPWRFQGRILESDIGAGTDLYDFGARAYDPDLGDFTSFDTVSGSALNPLTLNRYLYASANPATLVDPDGHCAGDADDERGLMDKCTSWAYVGSDLECVERGHKPSRGKTPTVTPTVTPTAQSPQLTGKEAAYYNFCMNNFANDESGTMPDLPQQQMTCNSQVAKLYGAPSADDSAAATAAAACAKGSMSACVALGEYVANTASNGNWQDAKECAWNEDQESAACAQVGVEVTSDTLALYAKVIKGQAASSGQLADASAPAVPVAEADSAASDLSKGIGVFGAALDSGVTYFSCSGGEHPNENCVVRGGIAGGSDLVGGFGGGTLALTICAGGAAATAGLSCVAAGILVGVAASGALKWIGDTTGDLTKWW